MAPMRSQRPELRPPLNPSTADYGFRPRDTAEARRQAFQPSLALQAIGPAARTPEELALRTSLRERLITPQSMTVVEYRERLRLQAQQKSLHAMRPYPVVLSPGEDSIEYEARFESWAEPSRKLSSMDALRASFSEVDVRIERKLRFDFAKVRAKRSLSTLAQPQTQFSAARFASSSIPAAPSREGVNAVAQGQPRSNVADPAASQLIAGKRGTAGVPALSPRGTDSHAHRAEPVEAAVGAFATQDELLEARQQAGHLRDHIHDVDARLGRTATELDQLAERTQWIEVPLEVWNCLAALEGWAPTAAPPAPAALDVPAAPPAPILPRHSAARCPIFRQRKQVRGRALRPPPPP
ncbi:hypothetical protein PHYSODRAFT_250777 [Phytophthora sojae]|uniref:Uncharacterized protein n=1 Tax=Phytophthora sojae (strain P6497) TaxID=1094619 RepID=G4ZWC8_PHYSP|nr:hypothetical protein PHYSODRAFT_250777 [Phytophthora sojae]EGZ11655.1 hypothetical protein PHYSODRAFT_250777 [Phytophthora sojae]|eukprot:XP_009531988.1 hypothetical protein PHYSODRAFT_250777 [Phytophthora sojae]